VVGSGVTVSGLAVGSGVGLTVSSGGSAMAVTLKGGTVTFGAHAELAVAGTTGIAATISGFSATDTLDFAAFTFKAGENLSFVENTAKTSGVLTITDGALKASVTLFGNYVATGFHSATDHAAGTAITYTAVTSHVELAGGHA